MSGRRFSRSSEPGTARPVCCLATLSQCHCNATAGSASNVDWWATVSRRQTPRHRHTTGIDSPAGEAADLIEITERVNEEINDLCFRYTV